MKRSVILTLVIIVLLLTMGSVCLPADDEQAKIIVIMYGVHEKGVFLKSVDVRYGYAPNLGCQKGNFTAIIRAQNGTPLLTFCVWDPRYQLDDEGYRYILKRHDEPQDKAPESAGTGMEEGESVDLPLIMPFSRDIRTVDLVDKTSGSLLVSVDISPAWQEFAKQFPHDPDVAAGPLPAPGEERLLFGAGAFCAIVLLAVLARLIRRS